MSEMESRALAILSRIAGVATADLEPEQDLVGELGIDSPKALMLLCDIEERCGIEVPDDAIGKMETVGDVLAMVRSCRSQSAA